MLKSNTMYIRWKKSLVSRVIPTPHDKESLNKCSNITLIIERTHICTERKCHFKSRSDKGQTRLSAVVKI